jgi:hypothetical protein
MDQSVPGGNFMWLRHARSACSLWLSSAEHDSFEGWHEGYHAPRGPGEAPAPDPAAQEGAPARYRGHAQDGRRARRRAISPLQRALPRGMPAGGLSSERPSRLHQDPYAAIRECDPTRATRKRRSDRSLGSRADSTDASLLPRSSGARGCRGFPVCAPR